MQCARKVGQKYSELGKKERKKNTFGVFEESELKEDSHSGF